MISWPNRLRNLHAAVATLLTGRHRYLSTACLHDVAGYCAHPTGAVGAKTPKRCKFCPAPCVHPRHQALPGGPGKHEPPPN